LSVGVIVASFTVSPLVVCAPARLCEQARSDASADQWPGGDIALRWYDALVHLEETPDGLRMNEL